MTVRLTVNILILLVSAAALGIIIYVMVNLKKVLSKVLSTGLVVVDENKSTIQPLINEFAEITVNDLLIDPKILANTDKFATKITTNILTSGNLDQPLNEQAQKVLNSNDTKNSIADVISSPIVSKAITQAIINALSGGGAFGSPQLGGVTPMETVLAKNIESPVVSNAIYKAVHNNQLQYRYQ